MRAPLLPLLVFSLHVVGSEFVFKPADLSKFSSSPSFESLPKDWHPMRIKVHYQNLTGVDETTKQKIMSATRTAVDYWQATLSVRRASKPLIYTWLHLDPVNVPLSAGGRDSVAAFRGACPAPTSPDAKCASIFHIPDSYMQPCVACEMRADNTTDAFMCSINGRLGLSPDKYAAALPAGVTDADYVLFVTARNCSDGAPPSVAKSTACNMGGIERVAFGGMIVCLDGIGLENDLLHNVIKHEILHVLGFSPNIFEALLQDRVKMEKQTHSKWLTKHGYVNHTVTVLKSRRVTEEVRKHFDCPIMQGAELESESANGSLLSHWEKRLFRGEVGASGGGSFHLKVTPLTLAFLEDSGWYKANYSMAEANSYGRGLGCEFVNESCGEWIKKKEAKKQRPAPYCNHQGYGCEFRRQSLGYCTMSAAFPERNETVPPHFQYFPDGGEKYKTKYMDNCPFYAELMTCSGVISKRIQGAQAITDVAHNRYGQEYGANSRCIDIGDEWTKDSAEYRLPDGKVTITGGCYQTKCENGAVLVAFGGKWHVCSAAGETIPVEKSVDGSILRGSLICPPYVEICGEQQATPSNTASTLEHAPTDGPSTDLLLSFSLLHAIVLLADYVYQITLYHLALSTVQPVYPSFDTMDYVWMGVSGLVVVVIGVVLAVWWYRKGKQAEQPLPPPTVSVVSREAESNASTRSVAEESQASQA